MRNSFLLVDKKGKNLIEIIWNEIDRERERIWKIARLIRGKSIINNNNDIYMEREERSSSTFRKWKSNGKSERKEREKCIRIFLFKGLSLGWILSRGENCQRRSGLTLPSCFLRSVNGEITGSPIGVCTRNEKCLCGCRD